jgi:arabinose-5-phosphate isomerase
MKEKIIFELNRVLKLEAQALLTCVDTFQETTYQQSLSKAVSLIIECVDSGGKIAVSGVGKSGNIAQKCSSTFNSVGIPSVFLNPTDALHGDIGILMPQKDLLFVFSYSGNTIEILKLVDAAIQRKVTTIGLGKLSTGGMSQKCDVWISFPAVQEACPFNLAPTSSTTVMLALTDAIAIIVMKARNFQLQDFYANHPAGSLGKRLSLTVQDVMHPLKHVSCTHVDTAMQDIIMLATQKNLGAVLILGMDNKLMGIITDGDIRRALGRKKDFFSLVAHDVMSKVAITIRESALLHDALELMEQGKSQVQVLPVLDQKESCIGLIRLHDIVVAV